MNWWNRRKQFQKGDCNEREKMAQSFGGIFRDGDGPVTSVRLWREERGKRRCRNDHGVVMEYKPV